MEFLLPMGTLYFTYQDRPVLDSKSTVLFINTRCNQPMFTKLTGSGNVEEVTHTRSLIKSLLDRLNLALISNETITSR